MSTPDNESEDNSLRYWKAAISSLSPEKRDAAWEFYLNKFGDNRAGDTLSGLILLLEAHGIYMQNVPLAFEAELVSPMRQVLLRMQTEVSIRAKQLSDTLESNEQTLKLVGESTDAIHKAADNVAAKIQAALRHISTVKIAEQIHHSLTTNTIDRLWAAVGQIDSASTKLDQTSATARRSVELWRKVHIRGAFIWAMASAIGATIIICGVALPGIKRHYDNRITEFTRTTDRTAAFSRKLQQFGILLDVKPALDSNGTEIPGTYAVYVPKVDDFLVQTNGKFRTAIVHIKPSANLAPDENVK